MTACVAKEQPDLVFDGEIPKLQNPKCVTTNFDHCGLKKIDLHLCPIWTNCEVIAKCILWENTKRSGGKDQLEPVAKELPINQLWEKMILQLEEARVSEVRSSWSNHMRKLDIHCSNKQTRVVLTDFSASLNLQARMADNCSVDNHAVLDIFFVLTDFREVTLSNGLKKEICTTDVFGFFGCSISSGKKNDHVFHTACIRYIIEYQNKVRAESGKTTIIKTIDWTDCCLTQYKCRQNFLNVSSEINRHANTTHEHKFAEKYHYKGSWDRTGKRIKEFLLRMELMNRRCGNAFACYEACLRWFVNNTGSTWTQFENNDDQRILEKGPMNNNTIRFGFVTKTEKERLQLISLGHEHVIVTKRMELGDNIKAITDTHDIFHVESKSFEQDTSKKSYELTSYILPCSCKRCREGGICSYLDFRNQQNHTLTLKQKAAILTNIELKSMNISKLTIDQLKA